MNYRQLIESMQKAVLNSNAKAGETLATPRPDFSGTTQMQAYIDAYGIRLRQVVLKDYPALVAYLGQEKANALAAGFVRHTPSRHYNLNGYALPFADYVKQHHPDPFAHALAALEATILKVYLAKDSPAMTHAWLMEQPTDFLLTHPLHMRTAFALLPLDWDAETFLQAYRRGERTNPLRTPLHLAICRHENRVKRHRLEEAEYALLVELAAGRHLSDALDSILPTSEAEQADLTAKLQIWLGKWVHNGFFAQPGA